MQQTPIREHGTVLGTGGCHSQAPPAITGNVHNVRVRVPLRAPQGYKLHRGLHWGRGEEEAGNVGGQECILNESGGQGFAPQGHTDLDEGG